MKPLKTIMSILLLILWFQSIQAQWSTSHLSSARELITGISAGSRAVFAGGDDNFGQSNRVDVYNYITGTWDTITLLYSTTQLGGTWCNGKVYVPGDGNFTGLLNIIDLSTKAIVSDTLPHIRSYLATVSAGGKVFYAGGQDLTNVSGVVDIYDTYTHQWSTAYLSVARRSIAAATVGNKVVFAGGEQDENGTRSNAVDIYDVSTGTWTSTMLSEARTKTVAAAAGTKILIGGGDNSIGVTKRVDIYDVVTGTWSIDSLSIARHSLAVTALGNKIYFGGGTDGNYYFDRVDVYNVDSATWNIQSLCDGRYVLSAASAGNQLLFAGGIAAGWRSDTVDIFTDTSVVYTGISTTSNSPSLTIYPNPCSDEIMISGWNNSSSPRNNVVITDLSGHIVFSAKNIPDNLKLNTQAWYSGNYFLQARSDERVVTQKFIVQH